MAGQMKNPGNVRAPVQHLIRVSPHPGIRACIPLTGQDADEAARIYRDVFLADEPTTFTKSPDPARFFHYGRLYTRFLAGKNLSFIVRDEQTHELAGFIFCIDMTETAESLGEWATLIQEDFREAMIMISDLEDRYHQPGRDLAGIGFAHFPGRYLPGIPWPRDCTSPDPGGACQCTETGVPAGHRGLYQRGFPPVI